MLRNVIQATNASTEIAKDIIKMDSGFSSIIQMSQDVEVRANDISGAGVELKNLVEM